MARQVFTIGASSLMALACDPALRKHALVARAVSTHSAAVLGRGGCKGCRKKRRVGRSDTLLLAAFRALARNEKALLRRACVNTLGAPSEAPIELHAGGGVITF